MTFFMDPMIKGPIYILYRAFFICQLPGKLPMFYEPQVNFDEWVPQEEADASPFEEENPEITFSGLFSPQ